MFGREKKKKTLNEFYTVKQTDENPISSITKSYRYSSKKDYAQIKYVTRTMSKQKPKPEISFQKDKYKLIGGKLYKYKHSLDKYVPIERNYYVDLLKIAERKKNDYSENKDKKGTLFSQFLHLTAEEPRLNPKLCFREVEKQARSSMLLTSRSSATSNSAKTMLTKRNFFATQGSSYKTPIEILSERCLTRSFKLNS